MGRAAAFDLSRADDVSEVGVFDIDLELARSVANQYGNDIATAGTIDAGDEDAATALLRDYDMAISCVTYKYNPGLTRAAIEAGCHLVDLGGNNDVVQTQLSFDEQAREAGVLVVPDCGLAPGMVAVLVADGVSKLDKTEAVSIRVGGLPQVPRPPLNYQMVFSAEGLINEYWEPCVILEGGRKKTVEPMTGLETLEFDGVGTLEAFYTSGGTSTLPDTYEGEISSLDYKTIRYPGHCQLFRPMLEIGLASRKPITVGGAEVVPRDLLKAVLDRNLSFGERDLVLARVTVEGSVEGKRRRTTYQIIDRQDAASGLTAMMRTTAFPAATVGWMAAAGRIEERGVLPQERCVPPSMFIAELKKRGIRLTITTDDIAE
jgi:lysine 6-dehydrogenase